MASKKQAQVQVPQWLLNLKPQELLALTRKLRAEREKSEAIGFTQIEAATAGVFSTWAPQGGYLPKGFVLSHLVVKLRTKPSDYATFIDRLEHALQLLQKSRKLEASKGTGRGLRWLGRQAKARGKKRATA